MNSYLPFYIAVFLWALLSLSFSVRAFMKCDDKVIDIAVFYYIWPSLALVLMMIGCIPSRYVYSVTFLSMTYFFCMMCIVSVIAFNIMACRHYYTTCYYT